MIRSFDGKTPQVDPTAFVSEFAYVVGDVIIGAESSVWPGTVIRCEGGGPIRIGRRTNIQDNCTLHEGPMDIGDNVSVAHNVVVHCRFIGANTLIGNGAILLDGAEIGSGCLVAAGAVVRPGTKVPDGSFVVGVPGEVRPLPDSLKPMTTGPVEVYVDNGRRYAAEGLGSSQ